MKRQYKHEWQHPEVKAKQRAYYQQPEVKAKKRAYRQQPEVKAKQRAYQRAYRQQPEVKAKKRASVLAAQSRAGAFKLRQEYKFLIQLEKPTVRQCRRLEALAEHFGRDIDEWRNEHQKKEYQGLME